MSAYGPPPQGHYGNFSQPPGYPPLGPMGGPPPPDLGAPPLNRPPPFGPPGPGGPAPAPGAPAVARPPPPLPVPTAGDKMLTLFVGGISDGVSDGWMEQVLKTCGRIRSWKRMRDLKRVGRHYGFVEYDHPDSIIRAMRVLGGEGNIFERISLPALGEGQVVRIILLRADENTKQMLSHHVRVRQPIPNEPEEDRSAYDQLQQIIKDMTDKPSPTPERSEPDILDKMPPSDEDDKMQDDEDLPADMPPEQRELIMREIAFFRDRTAFREEEKRKEEEARVRAREEAAERERQRQEQLERERYEMAKDQSLPIGPAAMRGNSYDHAMNGDVRSPGRYNAPSQAFVRETRRHSPEIDDIEEEKQRHEQKERDAEIAFRERERRWETREENRRHARERDRKREEEEAARYPEERERITKLLAEWNDDEEYERGKEEFYRDRGRWAARREAIRRKEEEMDDLDRQREEDEQRRGIKLEDEILQKQNETAAKNVDAPRKLNFNMAAVKRRIVGNEVDEEEEEDAERRKRRILVPLEYDDDLVTNQNNAVEGINGHSNADDRKRRLKALIDEIPADKRGLWAWRVRWDALDDDIISNKLRPFITKKIVDLLGVQEEDLTNFVLDHMRNKRPPEALVDELNEALDEEAPIFVMKLWRMLIFETEAKGRRL